LLFQGKLFILKNSPLDFVNYLFVASSLEPIGQEGFHELIYDLTGDQQGGQTLRTERKERK